MSGILTRGQSRDKKYFKVLLASLFTIVFLALFSFNNCQPSRILLLPLPSRIERIEGYASLRITGDQGSARSKFSFLFQLPQQGRIEVYSLLGRTLYQIIVDKEKAAFMLPSKKVYWQGEEEEIIRNFLGFRLDLYEMISLLSGKWEDKERGGEGENCMKSWIFVKDEKGRIMAGQRDEFRFEVKEFFLDTPFAHLLIFQHPLNRGRLKILKINFNQPIKREAFSLSFLENYQRKSWAEIEKMLANEN